MTHESAILAEKMWSDALFIHESEIEMLQSKGYKVKPLYDKNDISETLNIIYEYDLNKEYEISPNIKLKMLPNKHILGSCSYQLWFKNKKSCVKSIVFTGDLGNTRLENFFTYKDQFEQINCNAIICESTYGSPERIAITKKMREQEIKEIEKDLIHTLIEKKGNVVFPCFSLQRSQVLLKNIYDIFQRNEALQEYQVILDGRLTNLVTDVYKQVLQDDEKTIIEELLSWKNLRRIKDFQGTRLIISDNKPKVILTSQGFMMAGHSVVYAEAYVRNFRNTFIFTGYAPEGCLADKLKKREQKYIKINKTNHELKAETKEYHSFSSHIQHEQLVHLLTGGKISDCIVLIHGSGEAKEGLKKVIDDKLSEQSKTTKVVIPKRGQIIKV